jgi:hypothetical protein
MMSNYPENHREPSDSPLAVRPVPRCPINVRVATMDDLDFIDGLQKMHTHMVGWFPKKQIQANIEAGNVLIAEEGRDEETERRRDGVEGSDQPSGISDQQDREAWSQERGANGQEQEGTEGEDEGVTRCRGDKVREDDRVTGCRGDKVTGGAGDAASPPHPFTPSRPHSNTHSPPHTTPLGYLIGKDRYMGRDDVGILYQVNVLPLKQRHLIGATLVKAAFERAAYGCRLFSLWCAQDLQANWFWESLGFVPLAFRTGSRGKQRIHIFWQRRVRDGDDGPHATPYWFPSQTRAGAVREDRLVFPIPPGTHWRDVKPVVLPQHEDHRRDACATDGCAIGDHSRDGCATGGGSDACDVKELPGGAPVRPRPESSISESRMTAARKMAVVRSRSRHLQGLPPGKAAVMSAGGLRYVERADAEPELEEEQAKKPKRKRTSKPRAKHDPKHIEAARELRDRYLEQVSRGLLLPGEGYEARYDVSRALEGGAGESAEGMRVVEDEKRLLDAA